MNGRNPGRDVRGKRATGDSVPARPTTRANPAVRRALRGESVQHEPYLALARSNYALMGGGLVAAAIGFFLLSRGDITLAPLLIVVGYCALIPLGIIHRPRGPRNEGE